MAFSRYSEAWQSRISNLAIGDVTSVLVLEARFDFRTGCGIKGNVDLRRCGIDVPSRLRLPIFDRRARRTQPPP